MTGSDPTSARESESPTAASSARSDTDRTQPADSSRPQSSPSSPSSSVPTPVHVHVNRNQPETLTAETTALETNDSFVLELHGHAAPAHVHCRLDDTLARVATLDSPNYYIESDAVTPIPISISADSLREPVRGELEILTGYGSESVSITVTVTPTPPDVEIDESLTSTARADADDANRNADADRSSIARLRAELGLEPATFAVLALGALALILATTTAASIGGPVATFGVGVVVVGVIVALFLLVT
ncbi:hypothetical protein [Natrialba sp. PRR66]|uniref:DUF7524 family protein n=1 Tax=Natrialba sp. PRR66 TaxID=3098146 RepID=UPI002B1E0CF7|nr:hypothetical protein [Natrialba sp. PRR66]